MTRAPRSSGWRRPSTFRRISPRTPLNAILGFNEMIIDEIYGEVPPDVKEPLENIQTSGKHLLRLINNVLDLAKIEAGRMELALAEYSVHDAVSAVHSTLKPLAA